MVPSTLDTEPSTLDFYTNSNWGRLKNKPYHNLSPPCRNLDVSFTRHFAFELPHRYFDFCCVRRPQTSRPRGFSSLSSSRCILHQIPKEKKNSRRLILRVTPLYRPQFGCNRRSERRSFHWSDWRATIYRFSGTHITYISMTNGASTQ